MAIFITGLAGTGKSTVGKELQKKGYTIVDIDDVYGLCYLRHRETGETVPVGTKVENWVSIYDYECNFEKLKSMLKNTSDTIVIGVVAHQRKHFYLFKKVIMLTCEDNTIITRLKTRTSNDFGKDEQERQQTLAWREDFETKMKNAGAISLNSDQKLEDLVQEVEKIIKN